MDNKDNFLTVLENKYGVSITPVEKSEKYDNYTKINDDDFVKINACLQNVPFLFKSIKDANYYSGTYKVVYDKGLGVLQRSAKNPNLFRANVVAPGTNNEITGQALLQELNPSTLSNIAIASFTITSIATNQYFLARIDNKLESIEKKVNEIQRFLELDKESQLWADGEFLKEVQDKAQDIINSEAYSHATLTNVQIIRRKSLANFKLYYEQLKELTSLLNQKDNSKEMKGNFNKYKGLLPKYWYSVYLYELAYYLEVYLSNITGSSFLQAKISEMEKVINMYQEGHGLFSGKFNTYFNEVKALKPIDVPLIDLNNVPKAFQNARSSSWKYGAFVGAITLNFGAKNYEKYDKTKKEANAKEIMEQMEVLIKSCSDLEPFKLHTSAINNIDAVYNKRLELIVSNNEAFIKYD